MLQIQNRFRRLKRTMPFPMAAYILAKVCEGLDYAHKRRDRGGHLMGIIHRDVSPQNVLVSYEGDIKVIDFGIAKAASRATQTQAGVIKGKFGYMSPEQVRGQRLDHRSDLFAIATLMYELLIADRLFSGESDFVILEKVRNVDVPPVRERVPNCPPELAWVVEKGLARDPGKRYQWAAEIQEDLEAYLKGQNEPFGAKQLAAWMREQFVADLEREAEALREQGTVVEVVTQALEEARASGITGQGLAVEESGILHRDDLVEEEPEADATVVDADVPSEVRAALAQAVAEAPTPVVETGVQPTVILSRDAVMIPPELPAQATVLLEGPPRVAQRIPSAEQPLFPPPPQGLIAGQDLAAAKSRRRLPGRDLLLGALVALTVVASLFGARSFFRRGPSRGTLVVTLHPPASAEVWVDQVARGSLDGRGAFTLKEVPAGRHHLSVRRGDQTFEEEVEVVAEDVLVVAATLGPPEPPLPGRLQLQMGVEGATVFVDGAELVDGAWRDPIPLSPAQPHALRIAKAGFQEATIELILRPGEELTRRVDLEPIAAAPTARSPRVERKPPPPRRVAEVPELPQSSTPQHPAARRHEEAPTPEVGGEAGYLIANSQPWARVVIDGKDTGRMTPIAPRSKISLLPGKHVVTLVANGKSYRFDVQIRPGEDYRLIQQLGE